MTRLPPSLHTPLRWIGASCALLGLLASSRAAADDPAPVPSVAPVAPIPAGPPAPAPVLVVVPPAAPITPAAPPAPTPVAPAPAPAPPRVGPPLPVVADPLLVDDVAAMAPALRPVAGRPAAPVAPTLAAAPTPPSGAAAPAAPPPRPPAPPTAAGRPPRVDRAPRGAGPGARADAVPEVYNAVALRWGEARVGPGLQAVGLLPRVEVGTAAGALALGVYPLWGAIQLVDRPAVDLSLRGAGLWSAPGLVVRGQQLGGAVSVRPPGPVELGLEVARGGLSVQGLPADGSLLGRLTVSEGEVSRRISREIERQREGASAALVDPSIDARLAAAATTVQLGLGVHLGPRHQVMLLAGGAPQLHVDGRAALVAVGYARLIDVPGEVRSALPQTATGADALRQTASAALAYQWDRDALRVRVGAGVGGVGGLGWLPRVIELSWRPGPPARRAG
ncbi:MAG: hypothetical protein JNM72_04505 [Deltaproteobacteria bacterium]|nr:hypothetical protein [Deltaproteobacteria bacterium]